MNIWIIADTHFGHKKLQDVSGRPENCDFLMLSNIHKFMQWGDIVIHLGDVCIGDDKKWNNFVSLKTYKGKAILVKGNHDNKSIGWYIENGWDFVCDRFDLNMYGKRIAFTHVPMKKDNSFDLNIHGHLHNTEHHEDQDWFRKSNHHKLICMEHHYKPVSLKSIMKQY
jgi:calcineurin-like phosphoesterase family protein